MTVPDQDPQQQQSMSDGHRAPETRDDRASRPRDWHSGYSPVLVRTELKDELRAFRRGRGFHQSHIERCLMSAALEMLLRDPQLHERWLQLLADATRQDVLLQAQAPTQISNQRTRGA